MAVYVVLAILCPGAGAQLRPFGDAHAILGARIEIGDGRVIEKGDVLIRDGLIEAVGTGLKIPPDAEVLKGDGLIVFPGFIDACLHKGLKLPDAQPNQDAPPERSAEASPSMREANRKGVRADVRAAEWLAFTEADLTAIRKNGFTTALVSADGGLINGTAALVDLSGRPRRESVVRPDATLCLALKMGGSRFGGDYPGTILGYLADLRQTFLDADYQRRLEEAFEDGAPHRPPFDTQLAGLRPALDDKLASLIEADSPTEVVRALNLAQEFRLKPILCGGAEAWKLASRLAKEHVPVIVALNLPAEPKKGEEKKPQPARPADQAPAKPAEQPTAPKPEERPGGAAKPEETAAEPEDPDADIPAAAKAERQRLRQEKVANARRLNEASVLIAFTTRGLKTPTTFWENLRRAIKEGLPRDAALKGLALNPARIFGVERQLGTVEAGKVANLTLMTADFTDPKAETRYLFIDGWRFDTKLEKPAPAPAGMELPFGGRDGAR